MGRRRDNFEHQYSRTYDVNEGAAVQVTVRLSGVPPPSPDHAYLG